MSVTGHRVESSWKTYSRCTEPAIKRKMSDTISKSLHPNDINSNINSDEKENQFDDEPILDLGQVELKPLTLSNIQFDGTVNDLMDHDDELDDILRALDLPGLTHANTSAGTCSEVTSYVKPNALCVKLNASNICANKAQSFASPVPFLTFNNCSNITVNYSIKWKCC